MELKFLDFVSKAKELGLTEATFRARVLSHYEELPCFVYVSAVRALGTQDQFLPAWSENRYPFCMWKDLGSALEVVGGSADAITRLRRPRYLVSGWIAICQEDFVRALFKGEATLNEATILVVGSDRHDVISLDLKVPVHQELPPRREDGSFGGQRDVWLLAMKDELYWISRPSDDSKPISPRKDRSYLSIIAAMRELLMDKEGGNFPSQAKVIDELECRYGSADGISKRNLEAVFAAATRSVGGDLKSKA